MTQTESITKRFDGKVAVITGGNSGIGLATAQRLVSEGAYVFITGRRQGEVDAVVKQIGKDNVTGVQGDVSNLADLDRLYTIVKEQKNHIDILFANAGIGEASPLKNITEAHFEKIFNVNVKGLLFTVQKAVPLFQDGGSIVLNASTAGSKAADGYSVYGATKAAVRSFTRSWAAELKHRKIRVNAISPGPIDTPGLRGFVSNLAPTEKHTEQVRTSIVSSVPLGRMGTPDEVAKVVSFLASDDSSFITGIELFVDGGMTQI